MSELTNNIVVVVDETPYVTHPTPKYIRRRKYARHDPCKVVAYLPGIVVELCRSPGDAVKRGDSLIVLEAMKMKNAILSTSDGIVDAVHVKTGEMVVKNQLLVTLKKPAIEKHEK